MPFITCPHCHVRSYATHGERGVVPCPRCSAPLGVLGLVDGADAARGLERTLDTARDVTGLPLALLTELTGGEEVVRLASGGWAGQEQVEGVSLPIADTICRLLLQGLVDGIVGDVAADPRTSALAGPAAFGIRAYLGVTVPVETERTFVLCCMAPAARPGLGLRDRRTLEGLARTVAAQIDGALASGRQPWEAQ